MAERQKLPKMLTPSKKQQRAKTPDNKDKHDKNETKYAKDDDEPKDMEVDDDVECFPSSRVIVYGSDMKLQDFKPETEKQRSERKMQLMKILLYAMRVILTLLKMYGIETDAKSADDMFEPVEQKFKQIRDRVQKLGFLLCSSGEANVTKAMGNTKKFFVELDKETSDSMESRVP